MSDISDKLINQIASNESSDEEESDVSPRKRRRNRKVPLDLDDFSDCLDFNGFLDVETFFSDSFDWLKGAQETILKQYPNCLNASKSLESVQEVKNKPEYNLDLSTLELSQVIKHRRLTQELDDDSESDLAEPEVKPSTSTQNPEPDPDFKTPKPKCRKFIFKPFRRTPNGLEHDESKEAVDVIIPEQLAASYGLYLWPSAPVLAWYLWLNQDQIKNKRVLELGSGTALPGLLCAKFGAQKVFLTDDAWQENTLKNIREALKINNFVEGDKVFVEGLTWGDYSEELFDIASNELDYIIGSDLFFDPEVFEPLLTTISFLLQEKPTTEVLIAVQERSSDWSIEQYLIDLKLRCSYIYPRDFLRETGIEEGDLTGKHSIFLLKIFPDSQATIL